MTDDDQRARLTRDLFADAYPTQDPIERAAIAEQVRTVEERIFEARKELPSTSRGARTVTDAVINRAAPRRPRRRIVVAAVVAVPAIVAVVLGITERQWVAEAAISPVGIGGLVAATVAAGVLTVVTYVRSRLRRLLSVRVRIDAPFGVDVGEDVRLEGEHATVDDPGVVVARIKNTGGKQLEADDFVTPLALHFPGRRVLSVDATEFEPYELQRVVTAMKDELKIEDDRVRLPRIGLEQEHSFKLVIVLSGTKAGVKHNVAVEGKIRDGAITTSEGKERIRPATLLSGALTLLCAGALAVVLLLNNVAPFTKLPEGVACVPGSLTVAGSSAFGRAATQLSGSYHAYCPQASIKVQTPGSIEGLRRLTDSPGKQNGQLALADGRFDDPEFVRLVPQRLAIVPFTFVASENVPVNSLSVADVQRIFTGEARHWSDITGNPRDSGEIRVVGRSLSSGTRRTLERFVLSSPDVPRQQARATSDSCRDRRPGIPVTSPIVCEQASTANLTDQVAAQDDAIGYADVSDAEQATGVKMIGLAGLDASLDGIRAGYPFWTVEYVYSDGAVEPGSLPAAFEEYLRSPEGRSAMAGFQYYACGEGLEELCSRR